MNLLLCRLEQESGYYINMRYFEEMVANGEWEEVVKFLHGFTKVEDNCYSMKVFFEIQKQKFLEALDRYVYCILMCFYFTVVHLLVKSYGCES